MIKILIFCFAFLGLFLRDSIQAQTQVTSFEMKLKRDEVLAIVDQKEERIGYFFYQDANNFQFIVYDKSFRLIRQLTIDRNESLLYSEYIIGGYIVGDKAIIIFASKKLNQFYSYTIDILSGTVDVQDVFTLGSRVRFVTAFQIKGELGIMLYNKKVNNLDILKFNNSDSIYKISININNYKLHDLLYQKRKHFLYSLHVINPDLEHEVASLYYKNKLYLNENELIITSENKNTNYLALNLDKKSHTSKSFIGPTSSNKLNSILLDDELFQISSFGDNYTLKVFNIKDSASSFSTTFSKDMLGGNYDLSICVNKVAKKNSAPYYCIEVAGYDPNANSVLLFSTKNENHKKSGIKKKDWQFLLLRPIFDPLVRDYTAYRSDAVMLQKGILGNGIYKQVEQCRAPSLFDRILQYEKKVQPQSVGVILRNPGAVTLVKMDQKVYYGYYKDGRYNIVEFETTKN